MEESRVVAKWVWMTEYCKKMLWNPCDSYFWLKAEQEYERVVDSTKSKTYNSLSSTT